MKKAVKQETKEWLQIGYKNEAEWLPKFIF